MVWPTARGQCSIGLFSNMSSDRKLMITSEAMTTALWWCDFTGSVWCFWILAAYIEASAVPEED